MIGEVICMKIGVVGMGLIGGSFCRAFKTYTAHTVLGTTRNAATVAFAKSVGAIDGPLERLSELDMCLVALPPEATVEFLEARAGSFRPGAVVLDICGVKEWVVGKADRLYHENGVRYVGCHPMAGKETAGFANSDANLYRGASFIMTPTALTDPAAMALIRELMLAVGFARIVEAAPAEHDALIAYTSQLAHVVSSAYIQSGTSARAAGFSAGSFQDMTRVAKLDPAMWTTLFLCNREPLLKEIDTLVENLTQFRQNLSTCNREAMIASLERGRALREEVLRRQHGDRKD